MTPGLDWRRAATLMAHAAALAVLCLALAGLAGGRAAPLPALEVLVDRSTGVDAAAASLALADVHRDCRRARVDCTVREFGGTEADVALALPGDVLAALRSVTPGRRVLVISDGWSAAGETAVTLRAMQAAGAEPWWRAVPSRGDLPQIADWSAPTQFEGSGPVPIEVLVRSARPGLRVLARVPGGGQEDEAVAEVDAHGRARLELPVPAQAGRLVVDLHLLAAPDARGLDRVTPAAYLERAQLAGRVLHAGGSGSALLDSLRRGGWQVDAIDAAALQSALPRLADYESLVLEDVAIAAASGAFWSELAARVRAGELGLLALGLHDAWAAGGYRGSTLESLLPLEAVPLALEESATVVFALDKSGSMGERAGGVDRFALARRAVLESMQRLEPQDRAAVLAFDVEAREVVPLQAVGEALSRSAQPWRVAPRGGTSLRAGLDAALAMYEAEAGPGRRLLVLVTDGFGGEDALGELPERLSAAGVELVALAIGADADVQALERIAARARGRVLTVGEAAELPLLMRSGVERWRTPLVGPVGVEPTRRRFGALPAGSRPPPLDAHAALRARDGAELIVASRRGDPLLAVGGAGLGRVVAFASDFDEGASRWLAWERWPELAAALLEATRPRPQSPGLALHTHPIDGRVRLELDHAREGEWAPAGTASVVAIGPDGSLARVPMHAVAPGRYAADVDAGASGLYRYVAELDGARASTLRLQRAPRASGADGEPSPFAGWLARGWLREYGPALYAGRDAGTARDDGRGLARSALLALALFLAGVLIERDRELAQQWRALRAGLGTLAAALQRARASSRRRP